MRKLVAMTIAVVVLCGGVANADALSAVLALYGTSLDVADVEQTRQNLESAVKQYSELSNLHNRDEFFKNVGEVAETLRLDRPNLAAEVETNRKYLISLVNAGAELKYIFLAENDYRKILKEFNAYVDEKKDIIGFDLSGVTTEQVNEAADVLASVRASVDTAQLRPDIGILKELKSPVQGVWSPVSGFGHRTSSVAGEGQEFHNGLDLATPENATIVSLFAGKVLLAGETDDGLCVLVSHTNELQTFYAHLGNIEVKVGDVVKQYQKLGVSGGSHLHLGVFVNGQQVDPQRLFGGGLSE